MRIGVKLFCHVCLWGLQIYNPHVIVDAQENGGKFFTYSWSFFLLTVELLCLQSAEVLIRSTFPLLCKQESSNCKRNWQEASITWCDHFRPKFGPKRPKIITSHDVLEPLNQVLSASLDVIISGVKRLCCKQEASNWKQKCCIQSLFQSKMGENARFKNGHARVETRVLKH